jgi:arsenate reductase
MMRSRRNYKNPLSQRDLFGIDKRGKGEVDDGSTMSEKNISELPPPPLDQRGLGKKKILFLCTGNSCRSQMAEGWARHLRGDEFEVYSAGASPDPLNPLAVKVMCEAGVDISKRYAKGVSEVMSIDFDLVVTLCDHAREICSLFPKKTKMIHHGVIDPLALARSAKTEEEALGHYRKARDEIRGVVMQLGKNSKFKIQNSKKKTDLK